LVLVVMVQQITPLLVLMVLILYWHLLPLLVVVAHLLETNQLEQVMVALVVAVLVVAVQAAVRLETEIPRLHHHHKEITAGLVMVLDLVTVAGVVVAQARQVQMAQLTAGMVALELPQALLALVLLGLVVAVAD
jgi:hypothetical protein